MLQAMVLVFGFMSFGYFAQEKTEANRSLSRLCLYGLIPVLIFQSIVKTAVSVGSLAAIVLHFFATTLAVYAVLVLGLGRLLGWSGDNLKWNALSATLANVGYFGLAVVQFGLGREAVPYAVAVTLAFNLYMAVIGFAQVGNVTDWAERLRTVFSNPYLYAVTAGLVWKRLGLAMPETIDRFLDAAVTATLPITLILTGAELKRNRFSLAKLREAVAISAVKLLLPAALAWPLAYLCASDPLERSVMILMFGMPTSLNLLLLAKDQNRDTSAISLSILLTTLISPFTLIGMMKLLTLP